MCCVGCGGEETCLCGGEETCFCPVVGSSESLDEDESSELDDFWLCLDLWFLGWE